MFVPFTVWRKLSFVIRIEIYRTKKNHYSSDFEKGTYLAGGNHLSGPDSGPSYCTGHYEDYLLGQARATEQVQHYGVDGHEP